jgi:hypothetical protein
VDSAADLLPGFDLEAGFLLDYVPDLGNGFDEGSVSVIDGARCNARVTAGCLPLSTT